MAKEIGSSAFKLLGVNIPLAIDQYLSLYAFYYRKTKSKFIRQLAQDWFVKESGKLSTTELKTAIINETLSEWHNTNNSILSNNIVDARERNAQLQSAYNSFVKSVRSKMNKKGIDKNFIDEIISKIHINETNR